ncbi:MAG: molecular chaperone DjiA, partial [Rhodobacteraceae bacterium]|nr:molecular chaperone DjiA [Paracoccaceae bacterium]
RREFLKANHPDQLVARGLSAEMVALADARLAAFNAAYDEVHNLAHPKDRA